MIIKSSRLPARVGAKTTAQHVFEGPQNEEITVLKGSRQDLYDWVRDARKRKREFAVRHWKLSPERDITPEQEADAVASLAAEFEFDPERVVLIRHKKPTHGGEASEFHLHLLVPEVNPLTGKVLSTRWDYARHEKVSRKLEAAWGHDIVPGRFNAPVLHALKAEGHGDVADYLRAEGLQPDARAESAWPDGLHNEIGRRAKRSMPAVKQDVLDARALSGGDANAFQRLLNENGLRVARGDKGSRWVIQARAADGEWTFAGALHRLAGMRAAEADAWMLAKLTTPHTPTTRREQYDYDRTDRRDEGQADRRTMDGGGNGRDACRPATARGPAEAGPAGHDTLVRGMFGGGSDYPQTHRLAERPGGGARSERAGRHQVAAGAPTRAGDAQRREARRAHPSHQSKDGENRGGTGESHGGSTSARPAASDAHKADSAARDRSVGRLNTLVAAASMHHGFQRYRDDVARWNQTTAPPPIGPVFGERRVVRAACTDAERAERQRRFRLLMLRHAYPLSVWLPPEAVLFVSRVDYDPASARLVLTLITGTKILDTGDRVLVHGHADDIAVTEMAACVERRGWSSVVIEGDDEFRCEMARELLSRGIEVEDCPLDPREVSRLLHSKSDELKMRAIEGTPPSLVPSSGTSIRP